MTAGMGLEIIMLRDTSQSVKDEHHKISLLRGISEQNKLMNETEPEAWRHTPDYRPQMGG